MNRKLSVSNSWPARSKKVDLHVGTEFCYKVFSGGIACEGLQGRKPYGDAKERDRKPSQKPTTGLQ
jgi:hypothetical protein